MSTEELLTEVLKKVSAIERVVLANNSPTCNSVEACSMIGINNERILGYWAKQGLLTRIKNGRGYNYYKDELKTLAGQIKSGRINIPTQSQIK